MHRAMAGALQFQLSQTQHWPAEKLKAVQMERAIELLRYARQHCAYYRERDDAIPRNGEEWLQTPIIDRETIQQHQSELIALRKGKAEPQKRFRMRSSGSTGRPVEVFTDEQAQWFWRAITLRDHLWQQRAFSDALAVIKYLPDGEGRLPGKRSESWGPATASLFDTGPCSILNSGVDVASQYQWLLEQQPGYLLTYPSLLPALAREHQRSGAKLALNSISTMGELLSPETRVLAEQAFGCRVADIYSAQEVGYIALQCPKHAHYHIQSEVTLVEILDAQGQPCAPGELGRVVVTPLQNLAMPLIRYEVGDYAVAGERCDCGIRLPVLNRIVGRVRNLVVYPDGRSSWPSYNPMQLMELFPDAQFQLVQVRTDKLVLNLSTALPLTEALIARVKAIINEAMQWDFAIDVNRVEHIARGPNGKYEEFRSKVAR